MPASGNVGVVGSLIGDMRAYAGKLARGLSRPMVRSLRRGLWLEGKEFKRRFRQAVNSRFKIGKSKVGNLFSVYTVGDRIGELTLGMFTIWNAAPTYEQGGTIAGKGGWMLIPVNPKAYTAGGRIKKSWRDPKTGRFAADKVKDLIPIKLRRNMVLLAKEVGRGKSKRLEPQFLSIRVTRRSPVLKFFADFERYFSRTTQHLERAIEYGLRDAFAGGPGVVI